MEERRQCTGSIRNVISDLDIAGSRKNGVKTADLGEPDPLIKEYLHAAARGAALLGSHKRYARP